MESPQTITTPTPSIRAVDLYYNTWVNTSCPHQHSLPMQKPNSKILQMFMLT
jgi:ribosomal protein RSM22 (predicted rRNA methylase)